MTGRRGRFSAVSGRTSVVARVALAALTVVEAACSGHSAVGTGSGGVGGQLERGGAGAGGSSAVGGAPAGRGGVGGVAATGGDAATAGRGCGGAAGDSSGSGGMAGAGGAGGVSGGTTGAAGGGPIVGTVAGCPASPPSGCCTVESLVCPYPNQGCICDHGQWKCTACPATRGQCPPLADYRMWVYCQYGNVTCFCASSSGSAESGCGVCLATRPADGSACGNTYFECRYGDDTCACNGRSDGNWRCTTPSCSQQPVCNGGRYTCAYAETGQTCACGTVDPNAVCSCPAAAPTDGSPCVLGPANGTPGVCSYGGMTCTCNWAGQAASDGTVWRCKTSPCPTAMPTSGSACSSQLSCAYANVLCACDGATWSCS
jgi:hypothetical protein